MAPRPRRAPAVVYDPALPPTIPPGMTVDEYRRRRAAGRRARRRRIGTPPPLPPAPPELAVRHLGEADLRALRRGIAAALLEIGIGSPAARMLGRIMRLAGSELRRRRCP